jgi:hypothetical protein
MSVPEIIRVYGPRSPMGPTSSKSQRAESARARVPAVSALRAAMAPHSPSSSMVYHVMRLVLLIILLVLTKPCKVRSLLPLTLDTVGIPIHKQTSYAKPVDDSDWARACPSPHRTRGEILSVETNKSMFVMFLLPKTNE